MSVEKEYYKNKLQKEFNILSNIIKIKNIETSKLKKIYDYTNLIFDLID